jgi:hypothetical protein
LYSVVGEKISLGFEVGVEPDRMRAEKGGVRKEKMRREAEGAIATVAERRCREEERISSTLR